MRRLALLAAVGALAAASACRDWRTRVDPARAADEPEQVALADAPDITLEVKRHRVLLHPRATYRITGYAAETSRTLLDRWDFVMPMDVALVWGPIADPGVLTHVKFHLTERYVSYRYDAATPRRGLLPSHIANHHLIPATDEVAEGLAAIRVGDLVTLRGKLVDLDVDDPGGRRVYHARTSLTRHDVGSGACEILWVEAAEVERPE